MKLGSTVIASLSSRLAFYLGRKGFSSRSLLGGQELKHTMRYPSRACQNITWISVRTLVPEVTVMKETVDAGLKPGPTYSSGRPVNLNSQVFTSTLKNLQFEPWLDLQEIKYIVKSMLILFFHCSLSFYHYFSSYKDERWSYAIWQDIVRMCTLNLSRNLNID